MEHGLLGILIAAAFVTDIRSAVIPNKLTVTAAASGFICHGISNGWEGLLFALTGFSAGLVLTVILHIIGALGAGDVKLFAAIGAIGGLPFVVACAAYSMLFAGLIAAAILIVRRETVRRLANLIWRLLASVLDRKLTGLASIRSGDYLKFPFMYAVLPAAISVYGFGEWTW